MSDFQESILCSDCLKNQGLKLEAERLGSEQEGRCPNCRSLTGRKLDRKTLDTLIYAFFVLGTMHRYNYGVAPILQFNYNGKSDVVPASWLESDLLLLQKTTGTCVFRYGPRLWMIGEIEPLKELQDPSLRSKVVNRIVSEYPPTALSPNEVFYRLRKAPNNPAEFLEYDSPPQPLSGRGRIDSVDFPVMYGSEDIEICIHECRATAEDDLYVATLSSTRPMKLLNLTHLLIEVGVTEFDSLDLAVQMLFLAGEHSYDIIRDIARAARSAGFDGLNYPSYFSMLRTGSVPFETQYGLSNRSIAAFLSNNRVNAYETKKIIPNLAWFGRPIECGDVEVRCINRVALRRVAYDAVFGPVGYSSS